MLEHLCSFCIIYQFNLTKIIQEITRNNLFLVVMGFIFYILALPGHVTIMWLFSLLPQNMIRKLI